MIDLRLRFGTNKIPVLSNDEIEKHVDALIADYNPDLLEQPKALDVDDIWDCACIIHISLTKVLSGDEWSFTIP